MIEIRKNSNETESVSVHQTRVQRKKSEKKCTRKIASYVHEPRSESFAK